MDRVVYDRDGSLCNAYVRNVYKHADFECPNTRMHVPIDFPGLGARVKVPVFVQSSAFDIKNENDFLSELFGHEGKHVDDVYDGIRIGSYVITGKSIYEEDRMSLGVVRDILELRALSNQLVQDRQISLGYRIDVQKSLDESYNLLRRYADLKIDDFERRVIEEQLKEVEDAGILLLPKG